MSSFKYEIEYAIKASINVLYKRLSTASGLSEWFADNVTIKDNVFTFYWEESKEEAKILNQKENKFIRFQWLENEDTEKYFEFRIEIDDMTKDIALIITDFVDEESEKDEETLLWNTQIDNLRNAIGI